MKRRVCSSSVASLAGLALLALFVVGAGCATPEGDDDGDDGDGDDIGDDDGDDAPPPCGDGVCRGGETAASCPADCETDTCGDNVCQPTESAASCPGDCDTCGDDVCQATESAASCPADCNTCGDGVCQAGEASTCVSDCPASLVVQNSSGYYIYEFYVAPCGGEWSVDLLDGYIGPGQSATLEEIDPGCWYFQAWAGDIYWVSEAITLPPGQQFTWTLYN